jgi:CRP-like cAMP-binding protein
VKASRAASPPGPLSSGLPRSAPEGYPDSPFLDLLDPPDRALLLDRAVPRALAPGEMLFVAGDLAGRAHLLLSGVIKLAASSSDGHVALVGLALPGELIGDIAALDGLDQPLDAVAATPSRVLALEAELLVSALRRNPECALALSRALAHRMRRLYVSALERTTGPVPARLAGRLLDLAEDLGRDRNGAIEMDLPLGQDDLARLAGMCRESACKTLRDFKRAGVLDYRGRRVRLLRPEVLERIRAAELG